MALFDSTGLKRRIAAWISMLLEILRGIPGTEPFISPLELLAGLFGVTGIGQAAVKGGLDKNTLATASAILSILIAVAHFVPQLGPFMPILQKLAAVIGAMGLASGNEKVIVANNAPSVASTMAVGREVKNSYGTNIVEEASKNL